VAEANRVLVRLRIGGAIDDGPGVEYDDISKVVFAKQSPAIEAEVGCRQVGKFADSRFERQQLLLADILAEEAGKVAVGPRMRHGLEKDPFGRLGCFIATEAYPGER